ncbi:general amino acid permease GAP1 [Schizosaccharomyces japonicus yFS275]|uniref:General amino acid permease GAP1 n=1 Tax=Schizosaccharomyces japonicus (strain yFS275 / FY16936) TaxID=402676 RepID=B6K827_SCHJY|nr:general amino acid permease GAP1 [Schizosaccharomyces japonicus yFS275]EEB09681.1 general amino acid permease GAP1 [Schizosaccharomyces japonicus yFS275]
MESNLYIDGSRGHHSQDEGSQNQHAAPLAFSAQSTAVREMIMDEKKLNDAKVGLGDNTVFSVSSNDEIQGEDGAKTCAAEVVDKYKKELSNRHLQMIAIGGSIGTVGINYVINYIVTLPLELTSASIVINFWHPNINVAVWISIFFVLVIIVNILGVRAYGEVEFVVGMVKVVAVIGFIILGIVINCGGVRSDTRGYLGFRYWKDPGPFNNGFKGFCSVFLSAAFSFSGTEMIGIAASEAKDPAKNVTKATHQVFWRLLIFYALSVFIISIIIPSNMPDLLNASGANSAASPFVLAVRLANIRVLPDIINAVILLSTLSVGSSCTYATSRVMQGLSVNGHLPRFLMYVDAKGRPVYCMLVTLLAGCIAYVGCSSSSTTVFNWLLSLAGLSCFFSWGTICFSHIRFRQAYKRQKRSFYVPYRAPLGELGSWIGVILNVLCLAAQFYIAVWPIGAKPSVNNFFLSYLSAVIFLVCLIGWKLYDRSPIVNLNNVDLDLDRISYSEPTSTNDVESFRPPEEIAPSKA